ncbi:OB-fold-containig protein [Solimonas marina]|uniref:YqiJ family protein n=1 Tax=Solimonas marina TaxID=2714601 RepID=A0A969WAX1_9GAMM|nr:OB-fold-containig protein [Solimonas marina]NKF22789.1 YqiJ family protein [Solimonas marina]
MSLLTFVTAGGNLPFAISAAFLLLLLTLELAGLLLAGIGVSHLGEWFGDHGDADLGGVAVDALGYLHWGKVPLLVLLASLSGLYALAGFGVQSLAAAYAPALLPAWLASIPAVVAAVVGTHVLAKPIARLMPRDSGDAISERGLLSLVGRVRLGPVTAELPGEALVRDAEGHDHVVRIVAAPGVSLPPDTEVVITGRAGAFHTAAPLAPAVDHPARADARAPAAGRSSQPSVRSTS